jgi:hypothetical protein
VDQQIEEIGHRVRRIETRLARFLELHGHTLMRPPQWLGDGVIMIHDRATPIGEIMRVVPPDWGPDEQIEVRVATGSGSSEFLMAVFLSEDAEGEDDDF